MGGEHGPSFLQSMRSLVLSHHALSESRPAEESPPDTSGTAELFVGLPCPEGTIHKSGVGNRSAEGEESIGDKGKLIEHIFAWLEH